MFYISCGGPTHATPTIHTDFCVCPSLSSMCVRQCVYVCVCIYTCVRAVPPPPFFICDSQSGGALIFRVHLLWFCFKRSYCLKRIGGWNCGCICFSELVLKRGSKPVQRSLRGMIIVHGRLIPRSLVLSVVYATLFYQVCCKASAIKSHRRDTSQTHGVEACYTHLL